MSEILCVTNRKLCKIDFKTKIERLCKAGAKSIILREKDLSLKEYMELAFDVEKICLKYGSLFIAHSFVPAAKNAIHVPLQKLETLTEAERKRLSVLGSSVHSVQDAVLAQRLGATYLIAGHVFETDCKKGLPGRGVDFIKDVAKSVSIPVYAIGGITADNYEKVIKAGAYGAAVMSTAMTATDETDFLRSFA